MTTNDAASTDRPTRRWRFWLLVLGLPVLIAVLCGVGWLVRVAGALNKAIAEADRLDPHWRLEDIQADRATPPPGQNGADIIVGVQKLEPAGWPDQKADQLLANLPPANQLNDQQIATLKDQLGKVGPALAEARKLIDRPRGRHPIVYSPDFLTTLVPTIMTTRAVVVLLRYDVLVKAQAGDADGAIRCCRAAVNAGRSIGDEPMMIAQLARIACQAVAVNLVERTLAEGEPSESELAALQAQLQAAETEPLWLYSVRGERAGGQRFFESIRNGTLTRGNVVRAVGSGVPAIVYGLPGFLTTQQAGHLEFMNRMVQLAKRPPEEWAGALAAEQASLNQLPVLARQLVPAVNKMAEACQRNHALLRCAVVAIAAERYRRQQGSWPATPDDLVKAGLLEAVPGDPYIAGQKVKFARAKDGLIVYTTGPDGVDNGGKLAERGLPPNNPGTDYGLHLWDVAARRQPPLPPKTEDQP